MNEEEHVEIVSASSSPLVVSCLKCKNIVGDTYSYVCHDQSLNVMALSAVCNIKRSSNTVFTSKSGGDAGCTFTNLYCENCDETIGKFYITTSRLVDNLRDKFSLFVDKISVYKVGTANIGQYPPPEIRLLSDSSSNEQPLVDEIVKLKEVILSLNNTIQGLQRRVSSLENQVFPLQNPSSSQMSIVKESSVSSTYRVIENRQGIFSYPPS